VSDHALLAPSKSEQWMNCPGSITLTKDLPNDTSVYAREGTFAHSVAAKLLNEDKDAREAIGWHGDGDGVLGTSREFTVDTDMAKHLQVYLNEVRRVVLMTGGKLCVEQKVQLTPNVYGTLDAAVVFDGKLAFVLHIFDLKYGAGTLVPVVGNPQLLIYALAALATAGYNTGLIEGVWLHIVQPRRLDSDGEAHREVFVTSAELEAFRREVARAEQLAIPVRGAMPDLLPGDWCKFCKARGNCPALRNRALATAQSVFSDMDVQPAAPPPPATLSNEQLANILKAAGVVESWIEAVRSEALARATRGSVPPGYKLVQNLGNRKWIDEEKAIKVLRQYGIADPLEHTIISPAQAEKKNRALKDITPTLTMRVPGKTTLAPVGDARPALDLAAVFERLQ